MYYGSYTLEDRSSHVKNVNEFMISLPSSLSEKIAIPGNYNS